MPSRKTHTKSRHGCRECKFRKVKCDETRPQCQRCANRQTPYNYSEPFRINNIQESTSPHTLVSTPSPSQIGPDPPYSNLPQFLQLPILSPNGASTQIDHLHVFFAGSNSSAPHTSNSSVASDRQEAKYPKNRDMELLHHYTTSACLTLHSNTEQRDIWQISIPKLAFSNAYLLHGILCLSACHMSFQGQNVNEYNHIAKYHYTTALSLFRPLLDHIDQETGPPIVSFAMLLTILSMAMPRADVLEEAKGVDYIKYMVNNTRLIMGVKDVLSQCWPFIRETVIAPVLAVDRESGIEALGFEAEIAMKCIEARIHSDITDPELRQEYMEVTKVLRDCNPRRDGGNTVKHTVVLAWPALIPPRFFNELDEKNPIAMAMLLFFGALLHTLNDLWWADDKGKKLVEAIVEILPRGWESVIVWGKISVGLPCDYTPLN